MNQPQPARIAGFTHLALVACLLTADCALSADDSATESPIEEAPAVREQELETILVNGGQAVPQMWKVSRGEHVLWVVANRAAPAGSTWYMDDLDARMAESQLLMLPGNLKVDLGVNIVYAVTLLPTAFKAAKNPDGQTLKDVLPPETYARWRVLKTEYVGRDNDIEKWRPSIALGMLEDKIGDKIRPRPKKPAPGSAPPPRPGPMLMPLVEKSAKKHRVKTRTPPRVERKIEVDHVRDKLKSAGRINLVDPQCVAARLDYLEKLVEYWKLMADPEAKADAPKRTPECNEPDMYIKKVKAGEMPDSTGLVAVMDDMQLQEKLGREQFEAEWLAAAQAALEKNTSSFAVLQAFRQRDNKGYLDKLRERGYTVEEPAGAP
jgi:hypothetical protein